MPIFQPTDKNLKKAKILLENGGIIAYPTETFYALGIDPFNTAAIERLFKIKDRELNKPISIIIKDKDMLNDIVENIPPAAESIMTVFWPGPLTIVFNARKYTLNILTANTGKIAVRISSNPITERLLQTINIPLTATSANPSGKKSPVTAEDVEGYFGAGLDMIIDGGILEGKFGSTIIDATDKHLQCLREGDISLKILKPYMV